MLVCCSRNFDSSGWRSAFRSSLGLIDFFVTNFQNESNTLYLQDAAGLFVDATSSSGLSAPSWPFVGWGTQFLDADLDGEPDLVVANGHVDDYRDEGGEYHMRSQFFRNTGGGRFVELFAEDVGTTSAASTWGGAWRGSTGTGMGGWTSWSRTSGTRRRW